MIQHILKGGGAMTTQRSELQAAPPRLALSVHRDEITRLGGMD